MRGKLFYFFIFFFSSCVATGDAINKSPTAQVILTIIAFIPGIFLFGLLLKYLWEEMNK